MRLHGQLACRALCAEAVNLIIDKVETMSFLSRANIKNVYLHRLLSGSLVLRIMVTDHLQA